MPEMDHIRVHCLKYLRETAVNAVVRVPLCAKSVVNQMETDAGVGRVFLDTKGQVRRERILDPGEHVDLVPVRQRVTERLRVHLGTPVKPHWVAVNDLEDFHRGKIRRTRWAEPVTRGAGGVEELAWARCSRFPFSF